jgi:hypothetical protein
MRAPNSLQTGRDGKKATENLALFATRLMVHFMANFALLQINF